MWHRPFLARLVLANEACKQGQREFPFGNSRGSSDPKFPLGIPWNLLISVKFRREFMGILSNLKFKQKVTKFKLNLMQKACNQENVAPILLATNSKTGISPDFSKRGVDIFHFQNGNSRRPCNKSDNKGKSARGTPISFPSCSSMFV